MQETATDEMVNVKRAELQATVGVEAGDISSQRKVNIAFLTNTKGIKSGEDLFVAAIVKATATTRLDPAPKPEAKKGAKRTSEPEASAKSSKQSKKYVAF